MKRTLFGIITACMFAHGAHAGPLEDGIAAYEAQNHALALQHWKNLEHDTSDTGLWARYYLGLLHEYGMGVAIDRDAARRYYAATYAKFSGYLLRSEADKKALGYLPIDAVHRLAMIDVARSLEMENDPDNQVRKRATQVMQDARIALDIAGFYRNAESFFQLGQLEINGTGKQFLRNTESAWAHFMLAAELGHREAEDMAADLSARFSRFQQRDADEILESYREYIRPPD